MPFKSKKQQAFMFAVHPKIAKKWAAEMGGKGAIKRAHLPTRVKGGKKK
jgi:hypothetical protein